MDAATPTRLTSLAHGGGCGCKLSPAVLRDILAAQPAMGGFTDLLVGTETGDDAAVYRLNERLAVIATTDFFTPVVDDPADFGRIAATNALSDVYAMGGTPILALAILGIPLGKIDTATVQAILGGGAEVCARAGIPVAGGHSIDSAEPIYGLVALGTVDPDRILRNSGGRAGDTLILTKGLGVGVFSAAIKRGTISPADYRTMIDSTTRLNAIGPALAEIAGVHAATDVTGFGLLGHALELARGAGLRVRLRLRDVPLLPGARELAEAGYGTGAATRNWASYGDAVRLDPALPDWAQGMLCDPQTSGGLLIAADPRSADTVLRLARDGGFGLAAAIGTLEEGPAGIVVD